MKNKKIITSILIGVAILNNCCGNFVLSNAAYEPYKNDNVRHVRVPKDNKFKPKEQQLVDEIIEISETKGKEAALLVNEVESEETYEYAIKSVLEKMYTENLDMELKEFVDSIEENPVAEEIIENYEKADEERKNADDLNYSVDSIIVGYSAQTDEEYLEAVAEEQFGIVEEVVDTENSIDMSGLTDKKVEQIENIQVEKRILLL